MDSRRLPAGRQRTRRALGPVASLFPALLSSLLLPAQAQLPTPLALEGHVARGERLAARCAGCHAIAGQRNAHPSYRVPKLGGQNADYLEVALQQYRAGSRGHPTMHAHGAMLSDQQIADLAAYYSRDGRPETGIAGADQARIAAGRRKASACATCHGDAGRSLAPLWPNLAGQHASYLEHALQQYRSGARRDPVMVPLTASLSPVDIRDIAAFYATRAGLYTPARERARRR